MTHWMDVARDRTIEWDRLVGNTGCVKQTEGCWRRVAYGEAFGAIQRHRDEVLELKHVVWSVLIVYGGMMHPLR
jgi:hypothetical protein